MSLILKQDIMREYLKKCVRCGQCRYVCPVLAAAGKESASPRGKVYLTGLLQRGEFKPGPQADKILSLCLTCGACAAECPSGLPVDTIIKAARGISAASSPLKPYRIIYRGIFSAFHALNRVPGLLPLMRHIMSREYGLKMGNPARSGIAAVSRPKNGKPGLRVGYFLGCATNYFLPDVAKSVVAVLQHLGCEVVTPPMTVCCGLPLATAGEAAAASKLMENNLRVFRSHNLDAIVTDCSSCSHHLTEQGFSSNSQPVYEFSEFLLNVLDPEKPKFELDGESVACHVPCHYRFGRKLGDQFRQIFQIIPGLKVAAIPGGSSCCGGGGTFSINHKKLSTEILSRYVINIKSSGAQNLATVCPSCVIQLGRGLNSQGVHLVHPAQILYRAYGLTGRQ
ncbi:MAG: (Fe-S)-binding protein [Bacillota bacterium]